MPTATKKQRRSPADGGAPPEPDLDAALERVLKLMAIPGKSGEEGRVVEFIVKQLRKAGAPAAAIRTDDAHRRTPLGGEVGNLICTLPGTLRGPRRLLMAHLDTVPLCVGSKPALKGRYVHSADKQTGLGADDRAGCAVVLTAALEILRR
ncbi:MAG TPA: peptidase M20, partial [Pirellulales bacterium]|nr:peptidase M20 [Pirellulales bacterium]